MRRSWGVIRTYTAGNSWYTSQRTLAGAGVTIQNRDVAHTGCCKGYALATMLHAENLGEGAANINAPAPPRRKLDPLVRQMRRPLPARARRLSA